MNKVVLDASALLALLRQEPGAKAVENVLDRGLIGAVNLSEVFTKLIQYGMPSEIAYTIFAGMDIKVVPFDEELARTAANIGLATKKFGLSLGDRACLALGQHMHLPVITADRNWQDLDLGITIKLIR